jgi:hypothetical protein
MVQGVRKSLARVVRWAAVAQLTGLTGCFLSPIPDTRTTVDRARSFDSRCKNFSEEKAALVLSASVIDSVEPAYSYVKSGPSDRAARLRGARIHVRPLPGVSRELLQRSFECHEAAIALGTSRPQLDDPYALPDRWLDIDVESEGDGFAAVVQVDAFEDAKEVLARARRFTRSAGPLPH